MAYAGDAFTVAPLTEDAANIALFLDVLAPDMMPVDGQRADRAIAIAMRLLEQAGFDRGDILLLTDHADAAAQAYAAERCARRLPRVCAGRGQCAQAGRIAIVMGGSAGATGRRLAAGARRCRRWPLRSADH